MGTIHSTVYGEMPADVVEYRYPELGRVGTARAVLRTARSGDAVILNGAFSARALWADLLLGIALRRLRPRVALVIVDATWAARSLPGESHHPWLHALNERWAKLLLRATLGPRTHVCLLTEAERAQFARESGHPDRLTHVTPYTVSLDTEDVERYAGTPGEGYVFVGGDAMRDWDLLREALQGVGLPVRIATRRETGPWPDGVVAAPTDHAGFLDLLARSSVVCLPLLTGTVRSLGQQTYLGAMLLGKPVVVTEAAGVREMLGDDRAYVVPPDAAALRTALLTAAAGGPEVEAVAERGRAYAETRTRPYYDAELAAIARAALDG